MPERPDAQELLDVAREALLAIIGDVDPRHHYTLRMVANAMAIACREIAMAPRQDTGGALWRRVLACDDADTGAQRALYGELAAATRASLAVSNPKFLGGR